MGIFTRVGRGRRASDCEASRSKSRSTSPEPRGTKGERRDKKLSKLERLAARTQALVDVNAKAARDTLRATPSASVAPYSTVGPHPSEWKRRRGETPSSVIERVLRLGIVLRPSAEDVDKVKTLQRARGGGDAVASIRARRVAGELAEAGANAERLAHSLKDDGWELREVTYMPGDHMGFMRLSIGVGVIIVAVPPVLQGEDMLRSLRHARASGVLVLQSARVGHYLAHSKHLDIQKTYALPSKRLEGRNISLEKRCETRDDGYRELTLYVLSMPGTSAERNLLRHHLLPKLKHRCRQRRLRLHYVDLKDDSPNAGPGQALGALAHAVKSGGIFVVLMSAKHEIDWDSSVRLQNYVQFMKHESLEHVVNELSWLRHAPNDYSRIEIQLAHLLGIHESLRMRSTEEMMEGMKFVTIGERKRIEKEQEHVDMLRNQHILAYFPKKMFYEQLAAAKSEQHLNHLTSSDPLHKERIGSMLSTLYAHKDVSLSSYTARFYTQSQCVEANNMLQVLLPPQTSGLAEFEHTLFHDLLSTLDGEFPSDPYKDDVVVKASHGPELALAENLPFYFHRDYQEKGLIKALKTGLPTANIVQGLSGSGTTTMLQHLARTARQMFGRVDTSCEADRVVIVSDYGAAEGRKNPTPTQVLRNLAKQMKSALNVDDDVPASLENVRAALVAMFNHATRARGRVLVFIDALHSVDNESGASWLPNEAEIPIGVQFFLGIRRIDRRHDFVKESAHPVPFKMPALEYNLISSYRHRMAKLQHIALDSSCPMAMKNSTMLEVLKYEDRKMYAQRFLRPLGIHLTHTVSMQMMEKPCTGNLRGLYLTCSRIAMQDVYEDGFSLLKFPSDERDHYHQILAGVEKVVPRELLVTVLPAIVCGCNSLSPRDVAYIIQMSKAGASRKVHDLLKTTIPPMLWALRFFIKGDAFGGCTSAATGRVRVEDQVACDVVMERYAPEEQDKRLVYQMLAHYYGDKVTGSDLLKRLVTLEDLKLNGRDPHEVNVDGELVNETMFFEQEKTMNTINYLPYYYAQARMFDELSQILLDVDFLQAKLQIGEGQSLIDDFDRILPHTCGPDRPKWISQHSSTNEEVIDVPGAPSGIDGRLRQLAIYNSHCLGFHMEAYQFFASHGDNASGTEDLISIRDCLWRKLEILHRRPQLIRQQFFNDAGDTTPVRLCNVGIIEASESAIREYDGDQRMLVCWENKPSEALVSVAMKSGFEKEGDVRCIMWIDEANFIVGYASGAIELWDANHGSSVARFIGHERAVTTLALINNDVIKNGRTSIYAVSGSVDKTIRVWRLDDSLGRDCAVLTGHDEPVSSIAVAISTNELFSAAGVEVRCWSCSPGYPLRYVLNTEHSAPMTSISLAPDLKFMVTAAADGVMRLWVFTLEKSALQTKSSEARGNRSGNLDDGTSGDNAISSTRSSSMIGARRVRTLASAPPAVAFEFRGHLGEITSTSCASSGLFASSGVDGGIMLWEPHNAKHVGMINAHDGPVMDMKFSSDGKLLVSSSADRTCKVHSAHNGRILFSMSHIGRVPCVDMSSDASCLAAGAGDGTIHLWNWVGREGTPSAGASRRKPNLLGRVPKSNRELTNGRVEDSMLKIHGAKVTAICHLELNGRDSYFVTGAADGSVRMLDSKTWTLNGDITPLQAKNVDDVAFENVPITTMHSDRFDSTVYFGRSDGTITGWDFSKNSWAWADKKVIEAHTSEVHVMLGIGRGTLLTGGADGFISAWDVNTRSPVLMKSFKAHDSRVRGLCADESTVYSTGGDQLVKLWDIDREKCVAELHAHDTLVMDCSLTPRGLVTADANGVVKLWDRRSRDESARFKLSRGVPLECSTIAEQPNFLVATCDYAVYVIDTRSYREVMSFHSPHAQNRITEDGVLRASAFNPAGTRAVVGDAHGRAYALSSAFTSSAI